MVNKKKEIPSLTPYRPPPTRTEIWWSINKKWVKPVLIVHIIILCIVMVFYGPFLFCGRDSSSLTIISRLIFPEWTFFKALFLLLNKPHRICY